MTAPSPKFGQLGSVDPDVWNIAIQVLNTAAVSVMFTGLFNWLAEWQKGKQQSIHVKIGGDELNVPANASAEQVNEIISALVSAGKNQIEPTSETDVKVVRKLVGSITQLDVSGIYEEIVNQPGKPTGHRFMLDEGFLHCLRHEAGWMLSLFDGNGHLIKVWSTHADASALNGVKLLNAFVAPKSMPDFQAEFLWSANEHSTNIQRKVYATSIGEVTLHTRRHPKGSEIVISTPIHRSCLQLIWDAALGGVDTETAKEVSDVPF